MNAAELAADVGRRLDVVFPVKPEALGAVAAALGVQMTPRVGAQYSVTVRPDSTSAVYDPLAGTQATVHGFTTRAIATHILAKRKLTRQVAVADLAREICPVDESSPTPTEPEVEVEPDLDLDLDDGTPEVEPEVDEPSPTEPAPDEP